MQCRTKRVPLHIAQQAVGNVRDALVYHLGGSRLHLIRFNCRCPASHVSILQLSEASLCGIYGLFRVRPAKDSCILSYHPAQADTACRLFVFAGYLSAIQPFHPLRASLFPTSFPIMIENQFSCSFPCWSNMSLYVIAEAMKCNRHLFFAISGRGFYHLCRHVSSNFQMNVVPFATLSQPFSVQCFFLFQMSVLFLPLFQY